MYDALIVSGHLCKAQCSESDEMMRFVSPLLDLSSQAPGFSKVQLIRELDEVRTGGMCTICAITFWQMKIVYHDGMMENDSVLAIATDERQKKGKHSWG